MLRLLLFFKPLPTRFLCVKVCVRACVYIIRVYNNYGNNEFEVQFASICGFGGHGGIVHERMGNLCKVNHNVIGVLLSEWE